MSQDIWDTLLAETRAMHRTHAALSAFCPFPDDITRQDTIPHRVPAMDLFLNETGLSGGPNDAFHNALVSASRHAHWRETYKDTPIGEDFMNRFGCFTLIGPTGPFSSDKMNAWMTYMPPHLFYTWHHHVAEEAYLVAAGQATFFHRDGAERTLTAGDSQEHKSNEPHAMETTGSAVLCYVIWRNGFGQLPVLTDPGDIP